MNRDDPQSAKEKEGNAKLVYNCRYFNARVDVKTPVLTSAVDPIT